MSKFGAALAIAAFVAAAVGPAPAAQEAPRCRFTLQGAQVWTGEGFEARDLHVDGATFAASAPAGTPAMPAFWMFVIPPLVDVHTHGLDEPAAANDPMHRHSLGLGIYYALNPNNIRRDTPGAPFGPDQVEALYAGGGITGPGGHPRPLYEMLARMAQARGVNMGTLPGRAFHEAGTVAEARAAVDRVRAAGSRIVKLYLLDHRAADSKGLTPETFRAAAAHARARGMRAIVHIDTAADFRLAAETPGVAALMHMPGTVPRGEADAPYLLSAEDVAAARANDVAVVPTVSVMFNSYTGERLLRAQRIQAHNLRLLRDGGVSLVAGADRPGATMVDELNLLRATGLFDGTQLLNIGTRNALRLLFPDRRIGTFQPGSEASFLIMFADPRQNWFWIDDAMGGMRGGRIIADPAGMLAGLCGGAAAGR
jgi:imidazolonepropionase-like amidohydrolase